MYLHSQSRKTLEGRAEDNDERIVVGDIKDEDVFIVEAFDNRSRQQNLAMDHSRRLERVNTLVASTSMKSPCLQVL